MVKVVGIRFLTGGRIYYFAPGKIELKVGDYAIVETERGLQFGRVESPIEDVDKVEKKAKEIYGELI